MKRETTISWTCNVGIFAIFKSLGRVFLCSTLWQCNCSGLAVLFSSVLCNNKSSKVFTHSLLTLKKECIAHFRLASDLNPVACLV